MKTNIGFIMISLFIIVSLIISIRGIISSVKNIQTINESKSFRKTSGNIISIDLWFTIEEVKEADDIPIFKSVKTYEYTVNGKNYTNNKTQLFDTSLLKHYKPVNDVEEHNKWILETEPYKKALAEIGNIKQKTIPVFYDKKNPNTSCLTINIDNNTITKLALYVLLLVLGFVATFFFLRKTSGII